MFKTLIFIMGMMGVALARPQTKAEPIPNSDGEVTIVSQTQETDGRGTFSWSYKLSDGTEVEQSGYTVKPDDGSDPIVVVKGSYKYPAPDGTFVSRSYIADQNGFQPMGDDIPAYYNPSVGVRTQSVGPAPAARADIDTKPKPAENEPAPALEAEEPAAPGENAGEPNTSPTPTAAPDSEVTESGSTPTPLPVDDAPAEGRSLDSESKGEEESADAPSGAAPSNDEGSGGSGTTTTIAPSLEDDAGTTTAEQPRADDAGTTIEPSADEAASTTGEQPSADDAGTSGPPSDVTEVNDEGGATYISTDTTPAPAK